MLFTRTVFILIILLCSPSRVLWAQYKEIEGYILRKTDNAPIAYATVYNEQLKQGTISNADGYFNLKISGPDDSVQVRFVGFRDYHLILSENVDFYTIHLDESATMLDEVTITPEDQAYLYDLMNTCRKTASKIPAQAKAYYALKSSISEAQVEMVEGYYNLDITGYALDRMHLKAGRVGLQAHEDRFFASLESSRAITMLNLFDRDSFFPGNPLSMRKRKLKKSFLLDLESKYVNAENDSVYVITYRPKDDAGYFFEGRVWLNKSEINLIKITLHCADAKRHPFLPMFPSDEVSSVSFRIAQTFSGRGEEAIFKHVDFDYEVAYKSRIGESEETSYAVKTAAVLHAYDYGRNFSLPFFEFSDPNTGDYRKINALPYNAFFWQYHDEYGMNDSAQSTAAFFADANTLTNKNLFEHNEYARYGLFEHPYVQWSENRIRFREMLPDTSSKQVVGQINAMQYELTVQTFMDFNAYRDSNHVLTAAIFDPYESYFHLPKDRQTDCFVNMYFDLCEIKRRELEAKLKAAKLSEERLRKAYEAHISNLEEETEVFLKEVQRGTNEKAMRQYNTYINEKLGIDNIALFQIFGQ